jgi:hypothetical protein
VVGGFRADGEVTMRRWMLVVGGFYLLLGLRLLPPINGPMIEAMGVDAIYTAGDLEPGTAAFSFVLDWMGTFGASLLPLGAILLVAARDPLRNRLLVHLVIWHELVAGVLADAWYLSRGYVSTGFYLGFIALHLVIVATAIRALRRAAPGVATTTVPHGVTASGPAGVTAAGPAGVTANVPSGPDRAPGRRSAGRSGGRSRP